MLQSLTKIMRKTAIWTIFCFSPLPLLTMLRLNEYNLPQATLWLRNIVKENRGIFQTQFLKLP